MSKYEIIAIFHTEMVESEQQKSGYSPEAVLAQKSTFPQY